MAIQDQNVISLDQLTEAERKGIRDNPDRYEVNEKAGTVRIIDEPEASEEFEDAASNPTKGVEKPDMPDKVRQILEGPFQSNRPNGLESGDKQAFEPDPADVRNFLRCLFAHKPFTKNYSFYGGAVSVTLQRRTAGQEENALAMSMATGNRGSAFMVLARLRAVYSIVELRMGDQKYTWSTIAPDDLVQPHHYEEVGLEKPQEGEEDLADAAEAATSKPRRLVRVMRNDFLLRQADDVVRCISGAMREFDQLVTFLQQKADDPKYWATVSAG